MSNRSCCYKLTYLSFHNLIYFWGKHNLPAIVSPKVTKCLFFRIYKSRLNLSKKFFQIVFPKVFPKELSRVRGTNQGRENTQEGKAQLD